MEQAGLRVSEHDRRILSRWIRAGTTPQRLAQRARIVLLAADGSSMREIARRLAVSAHTVSLWRRRFQAGGPEALVRDAPGRGRKPTVTLDARARVNALLATPPSSGRWTVRALAAAIGISRASVHRVLKTVKLKPSSAIDSPLASRSRGDADGECAAN
jgi:transposase